MDEEIANCHFIPISTLNKVVEFLENKRTLPNKRCKRNLLELQQMHNTQDVYRQRWRVTYQMAVSRAIYAHDWNKLLYLLKKSPPWEHCSYLSDELPVYIRALTILLMNHPNSQAQGLLNDYLHMVLSCRSVEDKKAVLKVLLSLPEKLTKRSRAPSL